jgi:tRNA threonylcarbamoyl adenosine modification protein YeaZ
LPPEPYVLSFDTSAAHCAAALLSGDRVVALRHEEMAKGQAERLMPMLEEMLAGAGISWRDLAVIGVGTGPGNFTGVRIAVAAARGLALGLGVPAVGVTSLEAQALGLGQVVSSLDARRGDLYVQIGGGPAVICGLDGLPEIAVGSGCVGFMADEIAARCGGRVLMPTEPMVVALARLAAARRDGAVRPAPFYLRGADAAPPSDAPPVILP